MHIEAEERKQENMFKKICEHAEMDIDTWRNRQKLTESNERDARERCYADMLQS